MDFPTSAAYPLSYDETSLLLDEMQRQSSEMEASRDEAEEGYEINMTDNDTIEISTTDTWHESCARSAVSSDSFRCNKSKPVRQSSRSGMGSRSSLFGRMEAPLSPHIDANALTMDPPVGQDPDDKEYMPAEEGGSIMDTLSDLADGVDSEMDTVKGLLYKIKRERDTYKRSNHALQQSLSEAIAFKSDLEAEHRQALDMMLCAANKDKRHLEDELKNANDSKRKLKKLVAEMIEEKNELEAQLKEQSANVATPPEDLEAKLEEERSRHFDALSKAINDLEAKFKLDMEEVTKEKDEEIEAKEKEHKEAVAMLEQILKDAMEDKEAEMKREKHSHSMIVKALEDEKKTLKEELKTATDSLAMSDDVHDMEIADLRKEFEDTKSRINRQFKQKETELQREISQHSKAVDELETKLQMETMQCQALVSELATRKEEIATKDAEIDTLEKKLSERKATYTREYDRMKAHLTKMCNLVESSSEDRDRAREETKKLKAEHEKQNKAHRAEIEKLKRKVEDGAREMAQLVSSSSGESREKNELLPIPITKGAAVDSSISTESKDRSDKVVLLNRLEAAMKERDELFAQVQRLTVAAAKAAEVPACTSEESCTYLGDVDSGEPAKEDQLVLTNTSDVEQKRDSFSSRVQELETSLAEKDGEIAALNEKLEFIQQEFESSINQKDREIASLSNKLMLTTKELGATLEESCKEVASLNEKLDLSHQELENVLCEKNEQLAALEEQLELATQERDVTGTEEQDLCEYSMAKLDKKLNIGYDSETIVQERDQLKDEVKRLETLLEHAEIARASSANEVSSASLDEKADIIVQERDQLKSEVQRLEKLLEQAEVVHLENEQRTSNPNQVPTAVLNEKIEELARMEKLLSERDEELSDYKIKMCMYERLEKEHDQVTEEIFKLKAQSDAKSPKNLHDEITNTCLSRYEKDNESLRATLNNKTDELTRLEERLAKYEEEISEYKSKASMYESMERERDNLKSELITLKATTEAPNEESAAARLGKELSNLQVEHRVEIKLIKKDHATTKTKCKLFKKELQKIGAQLREMITAYDAERQSNAELSSSMDEMVTLLESERLVHSDEVNSLRTKLDGLKLKFNKMKKKRVPIDAAYAASRILLESYEASGATPLKLPQSSIHDSSELNAIEVPTDELHAAKNKAVEVELQLLNHASGDVTADESTKNVMARKQAEIDGLRNELKAAKSLYDELSRTYSDDMKATREELTKEMSRLYQAHDDSMQCHAEAEKKYEAEIAQKVAEVESLSQQLHKTKAELEEANASRVIYALQDESITKIQQQVKDEIRLKEESLARVHALERELVTANSLLTEKESEIEGLTQQLVDTKEGLDELETQLEIHVQKDGDTIQDLEQQVSKERGLREATIEKMHGLSDVIDDLKAKLAEAESKLKQFTEAKNQVNEELKAARTEIEQLNIKLASDQREQGQLVLESTERQQQLKATRDEIDTLNEKIEEYQKQVDRLQSECSQLRQINEVANCSQKEYERQSKKYSDEIALLKKQMAASEIKSKQDLKEEVDRLKSEFNEVITAFEKELVDTCESNANEVNRLQTKLNESKETISLLEIEITELRSQNKDINDKLEEKIQVEVDLARARKQLLEAESVEKSLKNLQEQHSSLMESFDEIKAINLDLAKTLEETESSKQVLKIKLNETLVSVDSNLQAYNDLKVDHDLLKKECDVLKGDSTSLHQLVSSLTSEKETLINDFDNLSGVKTFLDQEVEKYKNHTLSLEHLVSTLRDELELNSKNIESLEKDKSSKQQQINTLEEQSKIANSHLDEMVTYCDKLKTDFAKTSASLRKEIDEQAESMKDVINALKNQLLATETEKEENRKMYESDIELQHSEVEELKKKNADALSDLNSLSDLVSGLKEALEEEKSNSEVLRSQFKESEFERKAMIAKNNELQDELASKYASEAIMQERIRSIEMEVADLRPMPDKLTEMMKTESIMRERIHVLETQLKDLGEVEKKLVNAQNIETTMRDRIQALESQSKNFQMEYKNAVKRKEEESSKLRVVLQECREKLHRLMQENERLKHDNIESSGNLKAMLNEAIRSRSETEAALQDSLQLLEQQKRVDIKRKGELSKLEQTLEILKSKERYLESYVASLKNQINRGSR